MPRPGVEPGIFSIPAERCATDFATEDSGISHIDMVDKL